MTDAYNGDGSAPFVAGSDTSQAAAESIEASSTGLRTQIYKLVQTAGDYGVTCDEVEAVTGFRHQTASARLRELVLRRVIEDSFERRRTRSKRFAVVWKVVNRAAHAGVTP